MTAPAPRPGPRGVRRRGRRRRLWRLVVAPLAAALLFVLGVAVGRALEQNPRAGGTQTLVRTLRPLPLPLPPERETVTVTVTAP